MLTKKAKDFYWEGVPGESSRAREPSYHMAHCLGVVVMQLASGSSLANHLACCPFVV